MINLCKYNIKLIEDDIIEIYKPLSTILLYKFPYKKLENRNFDIKISNRFIVYILVGKNESGKDSIYVGKSHNGVNDDKSKDRPTSHTGKNVNWDDCYILTDINEKTVLNDGQILYIEDKIKKRIDCLNDKYCNITKKQMKTQQIFQKLKF